jgi:hypothetical protein
MIIFLFVPEIASQQYFQQEVNFRIEVTLLDKNHELSAFESIEYINNSPVRLEFLFFHLWPNAYSSNSSALAKQIFSFNGKSKLFNDPVLNGYIDSLDFRVDGQSLRWQLLPDTSDICMIWLNKPLMPGDTVIITTPFHVKIPEGVTSRLGHIGESYQISQWFPKPAVFDRSGWHPMPYLDQGEFYSEFGSYDVSITLPDNYIVAATGNVQNEQEKIWLDKQAADTTWKMTINGDASVFPASSVKTKTLRFTESNIHDFAWFADKRFHVMKGKVKLPESGREVSTWLMFTNQQANLWKDALFYVNDGIRNFSGWLGDYPYESFTAVQSALNAGSGMEYPGITVIGLASDAFALEEVITHEIGHNWFYSALGSDERRFPFMDESTTSAYESKYLNEKYPQRKLWEYIFREEKQARFFHIEDMPASRIEEIEWLSLARENEEQAINLAAPDYTFQNYNAIIYSKAALGFNHLRAYLGDSLFEAGMHDYYRIWRFRHPQPDDLRDVFELHTDKDLSWFFCDFVETTKRLDYQIIRFENQKLLIKNKGELTSPLLIAGMTGDSILFEHWVEGFAGQQWIDVPKGNYSELRIDPRHLTPEINRLNNNIRVNGYFKKIDKIQTQLTFSIENPEKRTLMYLPAINWTREDGFMPGIVLHNGFLVPKTFEYFIMPFYSFKNTDLAGYGRISYNIIPYNTFLRKATFILEGTQYGAPDNQNYHSIRVGTDLFLRTRNMNRSLRQKFFGYYIMASDLYQIKLPEKAKMQSFVQLGYQIEKTGYINPFTLLILSEINQSYQKASIELNYRYSYYGKDRGLDIRLFTGYMLKNNSMAEFHALAASGRSGREEYLYTGTYFDRFSVFPETIFSRQMTLSEGGLVSPLNDSLGFSQWLISVSFTSSLPERISRIPVKPFVNLLLNDHGFDQTHPSPLYFEAGLKAGIWGLFEVYVPLIVSPNIRTMSGSFNDRIRFEIKMDFFKNMNQNVRIGI